MWTNTTGGKWSTGSNWTPNQVPGANDVAVVTNAGTYAVVIDTSPSIAGLVVGGESGQQTVSLSNNVRLTVNGTSRIEPHGRLNLTGGDVRGSHVVEVGGVLTWASGALSSDTAVVVFPHGQVHLVGDTAKNLQGTLTNAGSVEFNLAGSAPLPGPGLNISGQARLNGSLGVHLPKDTIPKAGAEFQLLSFASHHGYSTNLAQPDWALLPGITNRWWEPAPLGSSKYFQLLKQ